MRGMQGKSPWVFIIVLIMGALLGSVLGKILGGMVPVFNISQDIGIKPTTIDLGILTFNFGLLLKLNLASVLGFILAYLLYKKL